jgi:hypothetical protein
MRVKLLYLFDVSFGKLLRLLTRYSKTNSNVYETMERMSIMSSAEFALQNFQNAIYSQSRENMWKFIKSFFLKNGISVEDGLILEFGVWKGRSLRHLAKIFPNNVIFGFDSFQGLADDWYGTDKSRNHFSTSGNFPKRLPKNTELIVGLFSDSLPKFIKGDMKISLIHLDADTYESTKYVLDELNTLISSNTILIFDEYFGYPNWENHEHRAFKEFCVEYKKEFRYLSYAHQSVAVIIL